MRYTEQELEEAKAYLRDRLRNEQSMSAAVHRLLETYAAYLLNALFNDASDEDIELLVQDLIEQILADCETLAVDEHDRRDMILLYMNGERNGDTLEGRINRRCHTFLNEVFTVFVAAQLLHKTYDEVLESIVNNLETPWDNEILVAAREMQAEGALSHEYDFDEPHYGRGIEIDSYGALDKMTRYAVGDAWMYWSYEDARDNGAKGYFVERGSSYPCDICDAQTGIFFYITDESHHPPFHLNCCCFIVYSYTERL